MKHKGQKMYILHPGDLKRYRTEKDFKWGDIRKIGYYPEEVAERLEAEKLKDENKSRADKDATLIIDMTEEELIKTIDELVKKEFSDDHLFDKW